MRPRPTMRDSRVGQMYQRSVRWPSRGCIALRRFFSLLSFAARYALVGPFLPLPVGLAISQFSAFSSGSYILSNSACLYSVCIPQSSLGCLCAFLSVGRCMHACAISVCLSCLSPCLPCSLCMSFSLPLPLSLSPSPFLAAFLSSCWLRVCVSACLHQR